MHVPGEIHIIFIRIKIPHSQRAKQHHKSFPFFFSIHQRDFKTRIAGARVAFHVFYVAVSQQQMTYGSLREK